MKKVELQVSTIISSQSQSGAYILILSADEYSKKIPVVIGAFEAHAIVLSLQKIVYPRPMPYDLFKELTKSFDIRILEVIIYKFSEGVFHAYVVCQKDGKIVEIDSRTSDAIAIAVRVGAPIYTYENILNETGIDAKHFVTPEEDDNVEDEEQLSEQNKESEENDLSTLTLEELKTLLDEAIQREDFEFASVIRDEIKRREKK